MTYNEAADYIRACGEDDDGPETWDDAAALFEAIFGRAADPLDEDERDQFFLWSAVCSAVDAADAEVTSPEAEPFGWSGNEITSSLRAEEAQERWHQPKWP